MKIHFDSTSSSRSKQSKLTVIANERYEIFAKALQKEIEEDEGVKSENRIKNSEKLKIKSGQEHFKGFEEVVNKQVASVKDLTSRTD
jgi:restriction endonuclease